MPKIPKNNNKNSPDLFRTIFSRSFLSVMVGMIVFGIMDNGIMVLAGSAIDDYIKSFGYSTMLAAGIGNTFSDAVGVLSGSIVARMVWKSFGKVTEEDVGDGVFLFGETLGIVVGCIIGLIPLAFI
jgi:hypothetical protein